MNIKCEVLERVKYWANSGVW